MGSHQTSIAPTSTALSGISRVTKTQRTGTVTWQEVSTRTVDVGGTSFAYRDLDPTRKHS